MAMLAWKLDGRGTVVDEVVDQGGIHRQRSQRLSTERGCRDPGFAYVIPATIQSYEEPRAVPTCLSRQGQAQNTLGKLEREGHPIQPDDQLRWVLIVRSQV